MCPVTDRTFSYRPGSWFGIVGEHATVLLPGSEKSRAGALWALVDEGAGFDTVLDALLAEGLSSLPGFVLLAEDGDTTRAVIRGEATAAFQTAEGTVRLAGDGGSMWVERTLRDVVSLSVTLPDEEPDGPGLRIATGLVRLAGLATAPEAAPGTAVGPAERAAEGPGPRLAPVVELVRDPLSGPIPAEVPAPEDEAPEDDTDADGGLGAPPSWTPSTPPPPPVGFPVVAPAPPAPPLPPVPTPPLPAAHDGAGEADDADVLPWSDDAATEQIPAVPSPYAAAEQPRGPEPESEPEEPKEPVAHLSFSSGDEIDVLGLVVIGRAPDAGRFPVDEQPLLVTVPSPHSEISSTHVEVRPGSGVDHGRAVVTDLGSTNGTLLVQPGQRPEELRPGVPVVLETGALIDLGDGLTIRVTGA